MPTESAVFLEVIEWFDSTGREIVHRIPERGSGEIKFGAQLTVRESQAAVLFYQGRAYDALGPGRHTLKTANLPILTKILSLPWGFTSPLRAEVVFANMKVFPNLKWGTRDPVAFKDSELGLVRLRAFGLFNLRVAQPVLFINSLVGTQGIFTTDDIEEYLSRVIVSRLNDHLGEHLDSLLNLPGKYDALAKGLLERLQEDFRHFGLVLSNLYIDSVTPPEDVQRAIDDKSRLGVFDDMNKLLKMKAAMAVEKAAASQSEAGAGLGMGMGMLMPALFGPYVIGGGGKGGPGATPAGPARTGGPAPGSAEGTEIPACAACAHPVPLGARFCPQCGQQQLVFGRCGDCRTDLPPDAKFCPGCGKPAAEKPQPNGCPHCGTENLPGATHCNRCGEKLG
jgi:membrane protease subunit (stomatin/prohibitin family)